MHVGEAALRLLKCGRSSDLVTLDLRTRTIRVVVPNLPAYYETGSQSDWLPLLISHRHLSDQDVGEGVHVGRGVPLIHRERQDFRPEPVQCREQVRPQARGQRPVHTGQYAAAG